MLDQDVTKLVEMRHGSVMREDPAAVDERVCVFNAGCADCRGPHLEG